MKPIAGPIRILAAAAVVLAALPASAGSMTPRLSDALLQAGPDDLAPVVVLMDAFPDRDELLAEVRGLNRHERRARVIAILGSNAEQSQGPIRAALATEQGAIRDVRVLWGINGLALEATPRVIERLAGLPGVRRVLYDRATGHPERLESSPPISSKIEPGRRIQRPGSPAAEADALPRRIA